MKIKSESFIRKIIRYQLNESAKIEELSQKAIEAGFACLQAGEEDEGFLIIYNPKIVIAHAKQNKDTRYTQNFVIAFIEWMTNDPEDFGPCFGAPMIKTSWADQAYRLGPLVYDYALYATDGLMADRFSVSPSAKKIWQKYFEREDVEKKKLDNWKNPKTPSDEDKCEAHEEEFLNYVYSIEEMPPGYRQMIKNNNLAMSEMRAILGKFDSDIFKVTAHKFARSAFIADYATNKMR